jgi:CRISPR-associated protein Cas1
LRESSARIASLDPTQPTLRAVAMGHEGQAAARYWRAFASLLPVELEFTGRHTHNASDPVNSAINYVYGLLYGEVWRAVIRAGLDPYFAILHGSEHDQGSLVFDLIEELRAPFGDRVVLGLIGRGWVPALDVQGMLTRPARRKLAISFYAQWKRLVRAHGRMQEPGKLLDGQTKSLKLCYQGTGAYQAFRFRW